MKTDYENILYELWRKEILEIELYSYVYYFPSKVGENALKFIKALESFFFI